MVRPPTRPSSLPVQVLDTHSAMASGPPAPSWVLGELELGLPRKNMEAGYSRNGMSNCRSCDNTQVTNQSSAHAKSKLKKASRHLYGVRRHPAAGIRRLCARSSPNRQAATAFPTLMHPLRRLDLRLRVKALPTRADAHAQARSLHASLRSARPMALLAHNHRLALEARRTHRQEAYMDLPLPTIPIKPLLEPPTPAARRFSQDLGLAQCRTEAMALVEEAHSARPSLQATGWLGETGLAHFKASDLLKALPRPRTTTFEHWTIWAW
jgi:hypothetical protein